MKLSPEIAEGVAIAAEKWAASATDAPLVITKTAEGGAVCTVAFPLKRYTKGEFAAALNFKAVRTLNKVLDRLGITPASDGQFDAETVEWARAQLKLEENRKTPHELRRDRGAQ